MTNKLLSDEELLDKLNELVQKCENTQWVPEQEKYLSDMVDIINTQKRLYAESVIGEDENNPAPREPCGASYRNQLRAEQRARINQ